MSAHLYKSNKDRHSPLTDYITPTPDSEGNWNACLSKKAHMRVLPNPMPGQGFLMQLARDPYSETWVEETNLWVTPKDAYL